MEPKDAVYAVIGRCAVQFEYVSLCMSQAIRTILRGGGLDNQNLASIVLPDLTAAPLKSMLQAMVAESFSLEDIDRKILDSIFKRVTGLIERRNDIIHSMWFISSDADIPRVRRSTNGFKQSKSKAGAKVKSQDFANEDFLTFCDECSNVAVLINHLQGMLLRRANVSDRFVLTNGVVKPAPP